ncbi:MAG: HEPN domain-containing protein [Saprospiraceae bacterium]|nr:HEPN domain-containing protein [Saprospiraceae bacterium]
MSYYSKEELSKYRLERARESIKEAKLLSGKGHWNTTASRLYYACFYAVSAYLIIKGIEASTHSGIKAAFNKELISTSKLPPSFGSLYNKLFNLRQDADYRDYRDLTEEDIGSLIQESEDLVIQIETIIEE